MTDRPSVIILVAFAVLSVVYVIPGIFLLRYSIDASWFTWTPPGSTVPRTELNPYWATLFPSLVLVGMGISAAAVSVVGIRLARAAKMVGLLLSFGAAKLAAGIMLAMHSLSYTFFLVCSDPGGCREEVIPFWPALLPGTAMMLVGVALMIMSRLKKLRGAPEAFSGYSAGAR